MVSISLQSALIFSTMFFPPYILCVANMGHIGMKISRQKNYGSFNQMMWSVHLFP